MMMNLALLLSGEVPRKRSTCKERKSRLGKGTDVQTSEYIQMIDSITRLKVYLA